MADEKSPNIDEAVDAAWDAVMGEGSEVVEDETHHLGVLTDDEPAAEKKPDDNPKPDVEATEEAAAESEDKPAAAADDSGAEEEEPEARSDEGSEDHSEGEEAQGVEAPEHWSSEDKEMFAKVPAASQEWLLGRHKQMEADYTRKTQENAEAIKVGSTFSELIPQHVRSQMKAENVSGEQFVGQLMVHYNQSLTDPAGFVRQVMNNAGLDPAEVFNLQKQPNGEDTDDNDDPVNPRIQKLERRLDQQEQARVNAVQQEARSSVQQFAEQKNDAGDLVYPHFDKVRAKMGQLMIANEQITLEEAYETCVLADPELRPKPAEVHPSQEETQERINRAKAATRVNKKGRGSAIVKNKDDGKPMSLADSMNAAADEIGL